MPYFTVPDGKMDEFKKTYADFYKHTGEGTMTTGDCTYYGFTEEGNTVHCREGYTSADGVLKHLGEVLPSSITAARSCVPYSLHKLAGAGLPISKGHLQRNVPSSRQIFVAPSICLAAWPPRCLAASLPRCLSFAHSYHASHRWMPNLRQLWSSSAKTV